MLIVCSREDMEKINIKFHDNGTVSFQHRKILEFMPELSVDKNLRIVVPNIPLLVRPQTKYIVALVLSCVLNYVRLHYLLQDRQTP